MLTTHNDFIAFLDGLNRPPTNLIAYIDRKKPNFKHKSYGTPEMELKFLFRLFLYIQKKHPDFGSISWTQHIAFNGSYHHLQLKTFMLDDERLIYTDIQFRDAHHSSMVYNSDIRIMPNEFPDPEEVAYAVKHGVPHGACGIELSHLEEYRVFRKERYGSQESACLKFIALLKLMEVHYGVYYFLYVFGNSVHVRFDENGVIITDMDFKDHQINPMEKERGFDDWKSPIKMKISRKKKS
jgi:hypothetical protein